jgi:hypothetical protein
MRLLSKPSPQTDKILMLMLGQIYEELQQVKQQIAKDKQEILTAIWQQDSRAGK